MSFEGAFQKLSSELQRETGVNNPVVKIQIHPRVWDAMLLKLHDKVSWTDNTKEILTMNIYGIEVTK